MFKAIAKPFGVLLLWIYDVLGNYGLAIICFALIVKLILLPFQMKSKRSMMRMSRFTPKIKELEKRYEGNKQKYQEEVSKLYREEKVNPMSGCVWTLIPFPILIALYYAIRYPITTMMGVSEDLMAVGGAIYEKLVSMGYSLASYGAKNTGYEQIFQSQFITEHFSDFQGLSDKLQPLDYHFLGLDLGQVPTFKFWTFDWSDPKIWLPALGLFLIPIISAGLSYLSMFISNKTNPQSVEQTGNAKTMMLMMPLVSLWICFTMPAALGIYWIAQSVFSIIQDVILTRRYTRILDKEDAERIERDKAKQAELEAKRAETERLRAEGATVKNPNTSKRKIQANQKAKDDERKAAVDRAEREERRARMGIVEEKKPDSQVDDRPFARGRAYVKDRYTNPETAEEKTEAAALASEEAEEAMTAEAENGIAAAAAEEGVWTEPAEAVPDEAVDEDAEVAGEEPAEEAVEAEDETEAEEDAGDPEDEEE